jgi:hypothetical protein
VQVIESQSAQFVHSLDFFSTPRVKLLQSVPESPVRDPLSIQARCNGAFRAAWLRAPNPDQ